MEYKIEIPYSNDLRKVAMREFLFEHVQATFQQCVGDSWFFIGFYRPQWYWIKLFEEEKGSVMRGGASVFPLKGDFRIEDVKMFDAIAQASAEKSIAVSYDVLYRHHVEIKSARASIEIEGEPDGLLRLIHDHALNPKATKKRYRHLRVIK